MQHNAEFRRCLEAFDVAGIRRLWAHVSPHLPQPANDAEALITIHMARTSSQFLRDKDRFYSHRWLLDHGLPSQLPERLKPSAEKMYPRIAQGVGISVNSSSEFIKPVVKLVQRAMADRVEDIYADDPNPDPAMVKRHMMEARRTAYSRLLGSAHLRARCGA